MFEFIPETGVECRLHPLVLQKVMQLRDTA